MTSFLFYFPLHYLIQYGYITLKENQPLILFLKRVILLIFPPYNQLDSLYLPPTGYQRKTCLKY